GLDGDRLRDQGRGPRAPAEDIGLTRRIRVARVIARMNVGGPALQVVNLTEGLDPERFETRLLVGAVGSDEGDYLALRAPHLEPVRIPGLGRAPRPLDDVRA